MPSTLQYCDTIYADITFDCKPYNFPSCTGAERVRSVGTNTILLYSGRTVLFGGCTNITGSIGKDQYISWRGVTIKGNTHAHHISCYWFIDKVIYRIYWLKITFINCTIYFVFIYQN